MSKRGLSIYVTPELYARIEAEAGQDGRTMSNWIERTLSNYMTHPQPAKLEVRSKRDEGQMDLEDAIAAAVKRGPAFPNKPAKHK